MASSLFLAPVVAVALTATAVQEPPPLPPDCAQRLHRAANAQGLDTRPGDRLVSDREGRLRRDLAAPGEVRLYYLVDRRVGGCPVAVVSPIRLDEANRAVGRDLGRDIPRRPEP